MPPQDARQLTDRLPGIIFQKRRYLIMELGRVTVQDCIDLFEKKGMETVIKNGKVVGFTGRREAHGASVKVGHAHKDNR